MDGFDLLGADGLADQYVTLRVLRIDQDKLRQKVGGSAGALASFGISIANWQPKMAIDAALPVLVGMLKKDYGVELEAVKTFTPPKSGRGLSEFWPGLLIGTGIGAGALVIWKLVLAPLGRLVGGIVAS